MSDAQRIIKYLAIALAVFIIFTIFSCIMYGISTLTNIFQDEKPQTENLETINITENITSLDVDVEAVNVRIKEGDTLKAEINNKYIKIKQDNNILQITEKKHNLFFKNDSSDLIIYIPKNMTFDKAKIDAGAGTIDIDKFYAKDLELDLGAGKATIGTLVSLYETEIDGGAGEIKIKEGQINNLDLDMGVGKLTLTSKITGNSKIDAGVGEVNINILGNKEEYKIKTEKGIGSLKIDGQNMKDTIYGSGNNFIDIDGGVGSINIAFK